MATEQGMAMQLAWGRILRIAARPEQAGDIAEYERCRKIIMEVADETGIDSSVQSIGTCRPGWNFGNSSLD